MNDFGIIVGCCKQDMHLAQGCCASIRYFLGNVDICLLVDGDTDTTLSEQIYKVQTLRTTEIIDPELRAECRGWGRSQLAMFWEAPWATFLMVDADALVWGDVLRHADFDRFEMIVDTHLADLYPDTTTSPAIAAFLDEDHARRTERKRCHVNRWYYDLRRIAEHFPEIDWLNRVDHLFCGGTIYARRGVLSRDRFLNLVELDRNNRGLFSDGNMGIINALVALEGIRVNRISGLQQLVHMTDPERMASEFAIDPVTGPIVGDRASILHWAGSAKPTLDGRLAYAEQMNFFRRRFLSNAGFCHPDQIDTLLGKQDEVLLETLGLATTEDRTTTVIRKTHAALAALSDPELLIASSNGVRSIASPFTAALVLSALAAEPEPELDRFSEPYICYLLETMEPPGLWRFSNTLQPILPLDADDSACALAALKLWDRSEVNYESALDAILVHALPNGTCPTWLAEKDAFLPGGDNEVDVVVNLNILFLAGLLGHPLPDMASFIANYVDKNGLNCSNLSLYYTSPFVFAYFLARWLRYQPENRLQNLRKIVLSECTDLGEEAIMNPLDCALAMNSELDLHSSDELDRDRLSRMANYLIGEQNEDGLWPPVPIFVDPAGNDYGSKQMTSVVCLEALVKYNRAGIASEG